MSSIKDMLHKFHSVNEALQSCTSYYAELHYDNDEECHTYWLVDGYSEVEEYLEEVGV